MSVLINDLITQLIQIQDGKNWIGTNFNRQLNSLTEEAFFYKTAKLHSIAEIISHLTTWRKETILKLQCGKGSITDKHPSNWTSNESLKIIGKDKIINKFNRCLNQIIEILKSKDDSFLNEKYYDTDFKDDFSYEFVIKGMLHHDLYHLGQIGIINRLIKTEIHK